MEVVEVVVEDEIDLEGKDGIEVIVRMAPMVTRKMELMELLSCVAGIVVKKDIFKNECPEPWGYKAGSEEK